MGRRYEIEFLNFFKKSQLGPQVNIILIVSQRYKPYL